MEFNFKRVERREERLSSEYLDTLVADYRSGVPGSSGALLTAFSPLIGKYFRLLTACIWDIDDPDVTGFLRLFGNSDLEATSERLNNFFRTQDHRDVHQDLVYALYVTAKRFHVISVNYKYSVYKRTLTLISDPITYMSLTDDELQVTQYLTESGAIDSSWVNGLTAGDGFDQLNSIQRAILKYIYNDGLADAVAAKKLHISVRSLRRKKAEAKRILDDYFHIQAPGTFPHGQDEHIRRKEDHQVRNL